jgi:hypothetical protein
MTQGALADSRAKASATATGPAPAPPANPPGASVGASTTITPAAQNATGDVKAQAKIQADQADRAARTVKLAWVDALKSVSAAERAVPRDAFGIRNLRLRARDLEKAYKDAEALAKKAATSAMGAGVSIEKRVPEATEARVAAEKIVNDLRVSTVYPYTQSEAAMDANEAKSQAARANDVAKTMLKFHEVAGAAVAEAKKGAQYPEGSIAAFEKAQKIENAQKRYEAVGLLAANARKAASDALAASMEATRRANERGIDYKKAVFEPAERARQANETAQALLRSMPGPVAASVTPAAREAALRVAAALTKK